MIKRKQRGRQALYSNSPNPWDHLDFRWSLGERRFFYIMLAWY